MVSLQWKVDQDEQVEAVGLSEVHVLELDHVLGSRCPSLVEGDRIVCRTSRL